MYQQSIGARATRCGPGVSVTPVPAASTVAIKVVYGLGEIPNAIKMVAFGLFTLYFYTTVLGLSGTLVGIASGIGLIWDAVIDPYVGYASDSVRSRFGRRHVFMLVGASTMGASFWLFFNPPDGLGQSGLFAWLLVTGLLVRTTTSVYAIPYFALGAELSQDYRGRTAITAIRGFLALLGTLAAASLSFVLFFPDTGSGVDPKLNPDGYPLMGAAFGAAMTILGLTATLGTFSRRSPPSGAVHRSQTAQSFFSSFARSLSNPSFRALFVSCSLFFLAIVVNGSLSIHYLTYYLGITTSAALSAFQGAFYMGGLLGVLVWMRLSKTLEKHHLYLVGMCGVTLLLIAAFTLVGEGRPFGVGNVPAVLVGHAVGGFFGSVLWFVPGSMIADIADEDELATGYRREASYFGVFYFGQQLAAGVSVLLAGGLVDWFARLKPGQAQQSAETIERLAVLFGLLPAALLAIAAVWILRYTLTRTKLAAIQLVLKDRQHERALIGGYAASSSLGNRPLSMMAARDGSD